MARVHSNDIELEVECHGPSDGRPLVLVSGLGRQLVHWNEAWIEGLTAAGHYVIVYDNRDVGLATHLDGAPAPGLLEIRAAMAEGRDPGVAYLLSDMAADLIGLVDALELQRVHVLGTSMGGMIAQEAVLEAPERFDSLTSIMSSTGEPGLPGPTPEAVGLLLRPAPTDRDAYAEYQVETARLLAGPVNAAQVDEAAVRRTWSASYERAFQPIGVQRQLGAITASPPRNERLRSVDVPTLVIHGDRDPLVPIACGEATAAAIPGARMLTITDMGHEIPESDRATIVEAISAHTA